MGTNMSWDQIDEAFSQLGITLRAEAAHKMTLYPERLDLASVLHVLRD
jgi:hypothetical protein